MQLGLAGKTALVTGASAGLGFGAAQALVEEGAEVVLCARGEERLASALETLNRSGRGKAVGLVGDVSDPAEPARIVADAERAVGPLWLLVGNAAGPPPGRFLDLDDASWESGYRRTLMSAVRLARAVLPGMIERRAGRIVFIASSTAKQPIDGLALSNVYRPAVIGLTKSLADETAPHGVTVNSVCPGPYRTGRIVELFEDRARREGIEAAEAKRSYLANVPVGRLGEPIELGRLIAFLGSEVAGFITGVAWSADGGQVRGIHG